MRCLVGELLGHPLEALCLVFRLMQGRFLLMQQERIVEGAVGDGEIVDLQPQRMKGAQMAHPR